jgi:hypothetical protein
LSRSTIPKVLSVARFGRASYFLTLLACGAKVLTDVTRLRCVIDALNVIHHGRHDARVSNALTELQMMCGENPSLARVRGGLFTLREAVCGAMSLSLKRGLFWDGRAMLESIDALSSELLQMPLASANFSVLVQRASITGTRALNLLRLGRDPFEGGEQHITQARSEGLENCWASSDDVWFEYCDVWVEALPLFIHEEDDIKSVQVRFENAIVREEGN